MIPFSSPGVLSAREQLLVCQEWVLGTVSLGQGSGRGQLLLVWEQALVESRYLHPPRAISEAIQHNKYSLISYVIHNGSTQCCSTCTCMSPLVCRYILHTCMDVYDPLSGHREINARTDTNCTLLVYFSYPSQIILDFIIILYRAHKGNTKIDKDWANFVMYQYDINITYHCL